MKNKTVIRSQRMGEEYLRLEHESGLRILLYPMKGFRTAYALFGADYGSIDNAFKLAGEEGFTQVPDGIAHYLEHKLFESEDGDAFALFARTGADANAYTSFDKTCYLFSCTDRFGESLRTLLRFVQSPYFTPETVAKEQGIIGQEIRMYEDDPNWRVMFNLLTALYAEHPIKVDIAGTVESIAQIDAELLYQCYNTFYNLSNMVLAIAGNFDPDEAEKILGEELKPAQALAQAREIIRQRYNEPREAAQREIIQELDVSEPLFFFGYKLAPKEAPMEQLRQQVVYNILLEALAGSTSSYYEEMNKKGLLNAAFGTEVFSGRGYLALLFGGESRDPKAVFASFREMAEKRREAGIAEEEFHSCQNALYGRALRDINNVESTASAMFSYEMMGLSLFDVPEMIAGITREEVNAALAESFRLETGAISIVLPMRRKGKPSA